MKKFRMTVKAVGCVLLALCLLFAGCNGAEADEPTDTPAESSSDIPVNAEPETTPEPETEPPVAKKRVAMTFDDGPHNVRTREIVDELDKYGFTATFFVVGNRVDGEASRGGDTVQYIIDHGHEVGIHGYTHEVYYDECTDAELEFEMNETVKAIREYVPDYVPALMRPIGGYITSDRVASSEYSIIMWNVDSLDYKHKYSPDSELSEAEKQEKLDAIVENVMSQVHEGAIILMHDIYLSTADATAIILERLAEEGYEVVSVSELLGNPIPGTKYSSAP